MIHVGDNSVSSLNRENDLIRILSKFNSDYVLDIIECTLNNSEFMNKNNASNAIFALDMKYTDSCNLYKDDPVVLNNLRMSRYNLYSEVIGYLSRHFDLDVDYNSIDEQNIYYITYFLYEIFINYYGNTVKYFVSAILKHKSIMYDRYNLDQFRKNKDASTIYNKQSYKNHKIAIIVSNLEYVIQNMAEEEVDFYKFLSYVYPENPAMVNMISGVVVPKGNLFKQLCDKIIYSPNNSKHQFIADIRVELSNSTETIENDNLPTEM